MGVAETPLQHDMVLPADDEAAASAKVPGVDARLRPVGVIDVLASERLSPRCPAEAGGEQRVAAWHMRVPRYAQFISGTGDVAAALLLARLRGRGEPLPQALQGAMAGMSDLIRATIAAGRKELALVQQRQVFVTPRSAALAHPLAPPPAATATADTAAGS